jgi:NADH-quinone oxidoreductase subunit L
MLVTVICICLFIGAMGKSAQFPLHVWLPDSMEGPTPISALIHAATMVTAGIFMVARMSPLFELSDTALNLVLSVGAITALFMGFLGIVQNDIKRVVAYSTLSQLGYMTVALGASAYSVAVFHLMTHAFFKALLFLAAGSVIMGVHHNQDIRYMGGLRKYMPITWLTSLLGSLALIGTPLFSGFYSKDSIIEAVAASHLPAAPWAHFAVLAGVFVTAFYSFRMYFLVFHGKPRFDQDPHAHHDSSHAHTPHESPWVVTLPLVLLAIPSVLIGFYTIEPMLFGDFFNNAIYVNSSLHPAMGSLQQAFHSPMGMAEHALATWPFILALAGVLLAFYMYMVHPAVPAFIQQHVKPLHSLLVNKYFLDDFNEKILSRGTRWLATGLWKGGDQGLIDGWVVNGSWQMVGKVAMVARRLQTGFLYHYALLMILGMFGLITWFVWLKP